MNEEFISKGVESDRYLKAKRLFVGGPSTADLDWIDHLRRGWLAAL